jgi:hypothetical protein
MPRDGETAINIGFSATNPIGRKSCGTWIGTFGAAVRGGCRCQPDRKAAAGTRMVVHQDLLILTTG